MAVAVEETKDPGARYRSQVDEQIAQTTGRIRAHDLLFGGLTLGAIVAAYTTAMILTDKYLNLAEWVRQLAFGCFLLGVAGISYWLILRPLRKHINPLYAAARVEKTIDDAKNSITGYVEAQEKGDVHVAVKAAMGARAARAAAEADVNHAVDHRSLVVAGSILLVFLLTLVVLFFVFRPSQFSSLVQRAIYPFSSDPIARRTQIELLKPEPAEPTITTGQTITVAVHIGGKVPVKNSPERVRVLLRHNQADPNFEEITMDEGETSRDWQVKVPDYLVQNGFWYKVAAGDNETPEYRVTVRTLPMFERYEVSYEYPAYTRKRPDKATGPGLRAYRGTKITLVARTNRDVKDGMLKFAAANLEPVVGKVLPDRPDSLQFRFTATEASPYKLNMTPLGGDKNTDSPTYALVIDADLAPQVQITKPEEPETSAVANGQLTVDGTIGDDFGIDKVRLRLRVDGRDLAPVPYMDGKSFLRPTDNTWPNDLAFKLSADLAKLKYADGTKFEPKFGGEKPPMIEYWVEAIDNCTETKPVADWNNQVGNVGRSAVKRLVLTPPDMAPEKKQEIDNQKQQRGMEEQQFNQEQQQKLDQEDRKKPDANKEGEPKKDEGQQPKEGGEPQKKNGESKKEGEPKKEGSEPQPKEGSEPKSGGEPKKEGTQPKGGTEPKAGENAGMGNQTDPKNPPKGKEPDKKPTDQKPTDQKQPGGATGADTGKDSKNDPGTPKSKQDDGKKGMNNAGMGGTSGMQDPGAKPETAPPPQSPEEKRAEEKARQDAEKVQQELNRNKGEGGDAKPNPSANAEKERTDPAQSKPQPMPGQKGMEPEAKPDPKTDTGKPMPMAGDKNAPAQGKPEGKPEEKPNPDSAPKSGPQPNDPKQPMSKGAQPSETRSEPFGGAPGEEKPEPKSESKVDPKDPKGQKKDPMSGSNAKPASEQPEPKSGDPSSQPEPKRDGANGAAQPKPNADPTPGAEKPPQPNEGSGMDEKPKGDPMAGEAKPKQAPPSAENKPMPKAGDPMADKQPQPSDTKPGPNDMKSTDPKGGSAAEPKPEQKGQPMAGMDPKGMNEKPVDRGEDKPSNQQAGGSKEGTPKDRSARAEGAKGSKGANGKTGKLDEAKQKELQQAAKDLNDPDPNKQQAARDKLDKEIGKDAREAIEKDQQQKKAELDKLEKDLKSPDAKTRADAEKKLKDLQEQARKDAEKDGKGGQGGQDGKGRELSQEEIKDLAEKANDLNSKDDAKRQAAEKALDDKLGKEARDKIQDEMKKRENDPNKSGPQEQENLKKKIDEAARNMPRDGKGPITKHNNTPSASSEPPLPAMEDDPRNRAKSAQLQLEEFEKHRNDRDLLDRLKWTDKEYEDFLKAQREQAERFQKEADAFEWAQRDQPKAPTGAPLIDTAKAGKVESRGLGAKIKGADTRVVVPPPGFEGSREKFLSKPKQR